MKNILKLAFLYITFVALNPYVYGQNPIISTFTPSSGEPGTVVNIYGQYFKFSSGGIDKIDGIKRPEPGYTKVRFGNYVAYPTSVTSTRIVVPVPEMPTGYCKIYVQNMNGTTESSSSFNVLPPPPEPITNIAYLHGFNSNNSTWSYAANIFKNEFNEDHSTNNSYNGLASISQTASNSYNSLVPYQNTVVVAHSMGGVLAREIKRQKGNDCRISALISVGTPHRGAPIAYNSFPGQNLDDVITQWITDLANPWLAYFSAEYSWALAMNHLGPIIDFVNAFLDPADLQSSAALDLWPNSSFMSNLNSNVGNTLPNAVYTIYGHEDWYSHWRLADATLNESPENNDYVNYLYDLIDYYALNAWACYNDADDYYALWLDSGNWDYYNAYLYWKSIGDAFNSSAYRLNVGHQFEWNKYIIGEELTSQQFYDRDCVNDAFIPKWSQAPYFVNGSKHYEALHTNHNEESKRSESIDQIRRALTQSDINLPN